MMDSDAALLIAACSSVVIAISVIPACCGGGRPEKKQKKKGNDGKSKQQSTKSMSLSKRPTSASDRKPRSVSAQSQIERNSQRENCLESIKEQSCGVAPQIQSTAADVNDFTEKEQSTQQNMSESDEGSDLILKPGKLKWNRGGGLQRVTLSNPTNERRAIKAKCSDNNLYRVNPVFAFIEPGQSINVDIVRDTGNPKVDKMLFVSARATAEDIQPKSVFKRGANKPSLILPLVATAI